MSIRRCVLLLMVCLLGVCSLAYADIPQLIRYQGVLVDSGESPLDGSFDLTFRIYDAETGGTALWVETQEDVTVSDGAFSVLLGSETTLDLSFNTDYWLSTEVESDGEMTPRQRLSSVAYAYRAAVADSLGDADLTPDNLLLNGSFEDWAQGAVATDSKPDHWNVFASTGLNYGATADYYRLGEYGFRLKDNMTDATSYAYQYLAAGSWDDLKGATLTAAVWARSLSGNGTATLKVISPGYDSISTEESITDSGWTLLSVTFSVPSNATQLGIMIYPVSLSGGNEETGEVLFDGAVAIEGGLPLVYVSNADRADIANKLDPGYSKNISSSNLIPNGSFESWSKGTSEYPPDGWKLNGIGASALTYETSVVKTGSVAVKISPTGAWTGSLYRTCNELLPEFRGRYLTFGCWVKSSSANSAKIRLSASGVNSGYSAAHSGSGEWEFLTTTVKVADTQSSIMLLILPDTNDGNDPAYFDGACLVAGNTPFNFSSHPNDEHLKAVSFRNTSGTNYTYSMMRMESGVVNLSFNGASEASVVIPFSEAFNKILGVTTTIQGSTYAKTVAVGTSAVSTTQATVTARHVDGSAVSGSVAVFWTAYGVD